jgi:hypothetical protein
VCIPAPERGDAAYDDRMAAARIGIDHRIRGGLPSVAGTRFAADNLDQRVVPLDGSA